MAITDRPDRLRALSRQLTSHWPGRIALGSVAGFGRLELFDRAMSLAAQLFTSIVPVLIMTLVWVGRPTSEQFAEAAGIPPVAQDVLEQALDEPGGAAFGIVGSLIVFLSATSLSRALTRAMATIWRISRPKTRLTSSWRWLSVLLALVLMTVVTRSLGRFTDPIPLADLWTLLLTFGLDILIGVFVPWLLLANQVPARRLLAGAVAYALAMLVVRPVTASSLPGALEESADRYGSLGVAFTYLAWLYTISLVFLAAAIIGNVIAEDGGKFGQFIRREGATEPRDSAGPVESAESAWAGE